MKTVPGPIMPESGWKLKLRQLLGLLPFLAAPSKTLTRLLSPCRCCDWWGWLADHELYRPRLSRQSNRSRFSAGFGCQFFYFDIQFGCQLLYLIGSEIDFQFRNGVKMVGHREIRSEIGRRAELLALVPE